MMSKNSGPQVKGGSGVSVVFAKPIAPGYQSSFLNIDVAPSPAGPSNRLVMTLRNAQREPKGVITLTAPGGAVTDSSELLRVVSGLFVDYSARLPEITPELLRIGAKGKLLDAHQGGKVGEVNRIIRNRLSKPNKLLAADQLERALSDLYKSGWRIRSPLGNTISDIATRYASVALRPEIEPVVHTAIILPVKNGVNKLASKMLNVIPERCDELHKDGSVIWIDIERPNCATFEKISKIVGIPEEELRRAVACEGRFDLDYTKDHLIFGTTALRRVAGSVDLPSFEDLDIFLTKNVIVTMHDAHFEKLDEIRKRIRRLNEPNSQEGKKDRVPNTGALLSRIVTAGLETSSEALQDLKIESLQLAAKLSERGNCISSEALRKLDDIVGVGKKMRDQLQNLSHIIRMVEKCGHLFFLDRRDFMARAKAELGQASIVAKTIASEGEESKRDIESKKANRVAAYLSAGQIVAGVLGLLLSVGGSSAWIGSTRDIVIVGSAYLLISAYKNLSSLVGAK